jgi:hypothetical protein
MPVSAQLRQERLQPTFPASVTVEGVQLSSKAATVIRGSNLALLAEVADELPIVARRKHAAPLPEERDIRFRQDDPRSKRASSPLGTTPLTASPGDAGKADRRS